MSLRVLVIPEDPTNNGYILRPLVQRIFAEVGRPNARVTILTNPRLAGYDAALQAIKGVLITRYRHFDLWLFLPDADKATNLEQLELTLRGQDVSLMCCAAQPEVEAWLLAGYRHLGISWPQVRSHPRLKEEIFEPFLAQHGDPRSPGEGRESLMREALSNYRRLLEMCPELKALEDRLRSLTR